MNTAMNDYIAQFVKGAQVLTATAVVTTSIAAILIGAEYAHYRPPTIAQTKVVGPVVVTSPQLGAIEDNIALLKRDFATDRDLTDLERRLTILQAQLSELRSKAGTLMNVQPTQGPTP
jgi:hypothetical protein